MNAITHTSPESTGLDHIRIITPGEDQRADWERLYRGYANFYQVPMNEQILATVWSWIQDPGMRFWGRLAELDASHTPDAGANPDHAQAHRADNNRIVGLMHFREMPSPLRGSMIGFLDDLFVDPQQRGSGVVDAMFNELQQQLNANDWACMRWITADNNYRGRGCYDRHASKTHWVTYQLDRQ